MLEAYYPGGKVLIEGARPATGLYLNRPADSPSDGGGASTSGIWRRRTTPGASCGRSAKLDRASGTFMAQGEAALRVLIRRCGCSPPPGT